MPLKARMFLSFSDGLKISYEEEVSGEAFFTTLAQYQSALNRSVLLTFADMEKITLSSIKHLLIKHCVAISDEEHLRQEGVREAEARKNESWTSIIGDMIDTYPVFIEEFYTLRSLAPADDAADIDVLIEHEQAMLDFATLQKAGLPQPMKPLAEFIRKHEATLPTS